MYDQLIEFPKTQDKQKSGFVLRSPVPAFFIKNLSTRYHVVVMSVQDDWSHRELNETIKIQILQMTEFLSKFQLSTRNRLSMINERLNSIERDLLHVESANNIKSIPDDAA